MATSHNLKSINLYVDGKVQLDYTDLIELKWLKAMLLYWGPRTLVSYSFPGKRSNHVYLGGRVAVRIN